MSYRKFLVVQIVIALLTVMVAIRLPGKWDWERGLGFALMVGSIMMIFTARFQLGQSFSITPQARNLVTHGIYSKIRNPIYVFGEFMLLGLALVLRKPFFWLVFLIIIPVQILRARQEAKVLEEKFGDEYREYRRKTWF
jgi:protein-S-isoprenylcysteine O-methyltransferase Ste14